MSNKKVSRRSRRDEEPRKRYGIRIKGGVQFNPVTKKFKVMVHVWDNLDCLGSPEEHLRKEEFDTEAQALEFYQKEIKPNLLKMANKENFEHTDVWNDGYQTTRY